MRGQQHINICRNNVVTKQSVGIYSSVGITTSTFADKTLSLGSNFAYSDKFPFKKFTLYEFANCDVRIYANDCKL